MMKALPLTPLMTISLTLTIGIIIAKWGYDDFNMRFWLIISIISCALSSIIFFLTKFLSKKAYFNRSHQFLIYSQCVMIHLCILSLGAFLTCKQIADSQTSTQLKNWQELPYLTRAKINTERYKSNIESKLVSLHVKQQDYAVIAAMALGDKSALDSNTRNSYSISGASHILAVSGLHIGIIFQLFIFLLGGRKYSVYTIILSLISIWTYVFLIGLPASAVRAAIMLSAYSLSLAFHRTGLPLNTLSSAYIFMLFISPLYLFELSFQLSFLAVASILLFFTPLYTLFPIRSRFIRWAWGTPLRFTGSPDRNPSGHRLHLRQNIVLFTSHQLHSHSRSNPHPISWSSINPVLPTHVMGAHSTGCRPTHQPYIRRPDQHHPVFEYSHKTDQHAAWSKHRKRKNQSASGNRSLRYHPAHLCPMAQDR